MKKIFFIIIIISLKLNAQDIVTLNDGSKIEAKVIEIESNSIKYKKFGNQNGPTYNLANADILEIKYENGEIESDIKSNISSKTETVINDTKKKIFIKTTIDSDVHPTQEVWKEEIERSSEFKKVDRIQDSDFIFEFNVKRAMGEARVSVKILSSKDNKILWESKNFRGTANIYNRMGASLHGIRKCIQKGIIPELEKGTF